MEYLYYYEQEPTVQVEHIDMTKDIYTVTKIETIGGEINMVKVPVNATWLNEEDFKEAKENKDGTKTISGVFQDEGELELAKDNKFGRDKFSITVKLSNGGMRKVNINNTSRGLLIQEYGEDSKGWIDKACILQGQTEKVAKKDRFVIYVRPK